MSLTFKDSWTVIHGLIFGTLFLLAFSGVIIELWSMRSRNLTVDGIADRVKRLILGTWTMAVVSWITVWTGTWVVYPWYREAVPTSPRSTLLADPATQLWHKFGMEWKEHVGWLAPILATAVAYIVWYFGKQLASEDKARQAATVMFVLAFIAAGVAGAFGAFLNKMAPTR